MHSHGPSSAEIFFLSGAPSSEDVRNQLALSGNSERTIAEYLKPHRINIRETYRACVVKEKLSYNGGEKKRKRKAADETNLEAYKELIHKEIRDINPSVIVPMDDLALEALVPRVREMKLPRGRKSWIQCFRGSIMPLRQDWEVNGINPTHTRVIPTYSPSMLNMYYDMRAICGIDYGRIARENGKRTEVREYGVTSIIKTSDGLRKWGNAEFAKNPKFLTFDIETYGSLITCISFCFDGCHSVSVPLHGYADKTECARLWQLVAKILNHPIPKVNQNIVYDWVILERHGCYVRNVVGDTMHAGHLIYPEFPKGLDFWTSIYTEIPYYKDEGRDFDPSVHSRDRLYIYNAKDSLATHVAYTAQLKELEEEGMSDIYHKEIVPLIVTYKDACARGMRIDNEQKAKLFVKYNLAYLAQEDTFKTLIGDDKFNPRSPAQIGELVYERLKFRKRTKKTAGGESSYKTDKITFDDILVSGEGNAFSRTVLKRVILLRKLAKVIQYISTPVMHDNVYRYSYNISGTETGRSSGSKSIDQIFIQKDGKWLMKNVGSSPQTIGKHGFQLDEEFYDDFEDTSIARDLRSMYVPRRGYCFVEGDGSGAEARAVGVLAADWEFMAHFDDKPKLHSRTAAQIYGVDPYEIDKNKKLAVPGVGIPYYDMGKRLRHGGNYGMSAGMIALLTHMPVRTCQTLLDKFHAANPKIREVFHHEIDQVLRTTRRLVTPLGRARTFFGRLDGDLLKEAIAHIPQSLISDHTKFSWRRIQERMHRQYAHLILEAHDGLLAEVEKEEVERYCGIFKVVYERPIDFRPCTLSRDYNLVIPAELSMSEESWMGLKQIEV